MGNHVLRFVDKMDSRGVLGNTRIPTASGRIGEAEGGGTLFMAEIEASVPPN